MGFVGMGFVFLVDCRGGGRILQWVLFSWSIVAVGEEFCSVFLLLHRHHLAGLCPRKKIQRLKRLCRSSAIRVVIMEKL